MTPHGFRTACMNCARVSLRPARSGPRSAFTVVAVTFPALDVLGLQPKNLPPLGITSGRRGRLLSERLLRSGSRNRTTRRRIVMGKNLPGAIDLQKRGYVTSDSIFGKVGDDQGRRLQMATCDPV